MEDGTIKVLLLGRWNEYSPGVTVEVTRGQAAILLARGLIAIETTSRKEKGRVKRKLSHRR